MPFFWKPRENARTKVSPDVMKEAVVQVIDYGKSVRATAKVFGIDRKTLGRYVDIVLKGKETKFQANHVSKQVFSQEQENSLKSYLILSAKLHFGLTPLTTRKFAFQFADTNDVVVPKYWRDHEMASYAWLKGFMHRHKELSLRSPQATSLGRATAFNKTTVAEFFSNMKEVLEKYPVGPEAIFNIDETGFTTVHKPGKIISVKGEKQVGKVTSAERGTLVTVCCAISAIGTAVPPVFVFPRVRVTEQMKVGAPPGSLCLTHSSGWMTGDNFELYLKHFIKFTRCSTENRVLIVLDNHESHITPKGLQICKENGISLVTLPPHTSHRLQPLDRTVFKPFKTYYNVAADDFMHANPGVPINIYHIPGLVGKSFGKSFTPENIQKGFACTGIWPLNSQIFSESDFLAANVTDRPDPTLIQEPLQAGPGHYSVDTSREIAVASTSSINTSVASTSSINIASTSPINVAVTPEQIRPFPKAGPRKGRGGRRPLKSRILTSTPVKTALEIEHALRLEKKRKTPAQLKSVFNVKRKCFATSDVAELGGSSESSSSYSETDSDKDSDISEEEPGINPTSFEVDDYALVKFSSKRSVFYYAGKVTKKHNELEFEVKFLRCCSRNSKCFIFPDKDDVADVVIHDMLKLPKPTELRGTERVASKLSFKVNFSKYEIR